MKNLPKTGFPVLLGFRESSRHLFPGLWNQNPGKKIFSFFRSCATCIMSLLIMLGLELLSNLWSQMGPTVSKWYNLNVPGH